MLFSLACEETGFPSAAVKQTPRDICLSDSIVRSKTGDWNSGLGSMTGDCCPEKSGATDEKTWTVCICRCHCNSSSYPFLSTITGLWKWPFWTFFRTVRRSQGRTTLGRQSVLNTQAKLLLTNHFGSQLTHSAKRCRLTTLLGDWLQWQGQDGRLPYCWWDNGASGSSIRLNRFSWRRSKICTFALQKFLNEGISLFP